MHPITDAFIKGRAKFKKISNRYFEIKPTDPPSKAKGCCHLGAILYGVYGDSAIISPFEHLMQLKNDFPEIAGNHMVDIPCDDEIRTEHNIGNITSILIHLNDQHDGRSGWTDKKVAEWLDKVLTNA